MNDLLDLERGLLLQKLAKDDFRGTDLDRVLSTSQEELHCKSVFLEVLQVEVIDLVLERELSSIVGLETL
jgi:hypothetical protein